MNILKQLQGGDRRSIGKSDFVVQYVLKNPATFAHVFAGLWDDDPVVRMRAADAVEKVTRKQPELLQSWKRQLLGIAAFTKDKEVRWHFAQMAPRLRLTPPEQKQAVQILTGYLESDSSIVKTFSMQALADLAAKDKNLLDEVMPQIERLTRSGTPAMRSRGRRLLKQMRVPSGT